MHNVLKRLELQGFKSFAGKTVLDFPARVVAIVGPNGSGKSNIIDALRWVLGEREAKKLRGETLDNLIFAGTAKKSAVGLTRVTLYLDNRKRNFPLDVEEIMLVRKADRSGTSEFTWNGKEIKLKDLAPILAKSRLGSRGLTIVSQGQSDIFVRSTPEERRNMIEEILGLKEFRLKKHTCERRLETSRINMDKAQAMINELSPHLRFLRKQRTRFEKRSEIENKLINFENEYFSFNHNKLKSSLVDVSEPITKFLGEQKTREKEIGVLEENLKSVNKKTDELSKAKDVRLLLTELFDSKSSLEKELGRLEAKIEFQKPTSSSNSSLVEITDVVQTITKEIELTLKLDNVSDIKNALKDWLQKFKNLLKEDATSDKTNLVDEQKELEREITAINVKIENLRGEEEQLAEEQESANQEFREKVEYLELKKNELRGLEQKMQTQFFEKEKIQLKLGELEREWQSFGRSIDELKNLPKISKEIDSPDVERKMVRLRAELAAIGEIDEGLVNEAKESEERYEFLNRELEDLKKAVTDLKNLIKDLDQKIHSDFRSSFKQINEEFNKYFRLMFGEGKAKLKLQTYKPKDMDLEKGMEIEDNEDDQELRAGVEIDLSVPRKSIKGIDMLSGGEKSLTSLAALFALISVSPPPFLVLDEIDAALDEKNTQRFAELVKEFSKKTQFVLITHNRATMEAADALYGITMGDDGVSRVLSLKLEKT